MSVSIQVSVSPKQRRRSLANVAGQRAKAAEGVLERHKIVIVVISLAGAILKFGTELIEFVTKI